MTKASKNIEKLENIVDLSADFGAVGDGVSDDTTAIQSAFNSGKRVKIPQGVFKFTSTITLPAGLVVECEGTLLKAFAGTGMRNTNYNNPASTDSGYELIGLRIRQSSSTDRGNVVELVNVSNVLVDKLDIVQIATTGAQGAWSLYISGENIRITRPYIDSTAGTIFADGIHTAYVKNLIISDGIILAGDDAIAINPPNKTWENAGKNLPGGNISISNMVLSSAAANLIRIGASSVAAGSVDALDAVVFDGINISNIVEGSVTKTGGNVITIDDGRDTGAITGVHKNIVISNVITRSVAVGNVISIKGNPDVTNIANISKKNFGSITFKNCSFQNSSNGSSLFGGGVESLVLEGCQLYRNFVASVNAIDAYTVGTFTIRDSYLEAGSAGTTGTAFRIRYTGNVDIYSSKLQSGGEFRTLTYDSNASAASNLRVFGSWINGAVRGIDNLDGTGYLSLVVSNTQFNCSTSDLTAAALVATTKSVEKSGKYATYQGTTGGTGSAGAGTQYVGLTINGLNYKILHDGTF